MSKVHIIPYSTCSSAGSIIRLRFRCCYYGCRPQTTEEILWKSKEDERTFRNVNGAYGFKAKLDDTGVRASTIYEKEPQYGNVGNSFNLTSAEYEGDMLTYEDENKTESTNEASGYGTGLAYPDETFRQDERYTLAWENLIRKLSHEDVDEKNSARTTTDASTAKFGDETLKRERRAVSTRNTKRSLRVQKFETMEVTTAVQVALYFNGCKWKVSYELQSLHNVLYTFAENVEQLTFWTQ